MAVKPGEIQLVVRINQLEADITALKTEYEQYFMGILRIPPQTKHRVVKRTISELEARPINNATLRFRFQQIKSRLITFESYWRRTLHQIETGKHRRDQYRYQRRHGDAQTGAADESPEEAHQESEAPKAPKASAPNTLDSLYQDFVRGRESTGEPTHNISREKLALFIQGQEANIRKKYGDRKVDFKVVVEDGKTRLRAILKK